MAQGYDPAKVITEKVAEDHNARGLAIIVTNDYIGNTGRLTELPMTHDDGREMEKTFKELKFVTHREKNVTTPHHQSIIDAITQIKHPYSNGYYKCIVYVFSGHGGEGDSLSLQDCGRVNLVKDVIEKLCHPRIAHIPKLFFIDACRGGEHNPVHQGQSSALHRIARTILKKIRPRRRPVQLNDNALIAALKGNFLIAYATTDMRVAPAMTGEGSWMQILARELRESGRSVQEVTAMARKTLLEEYIKEKQQRPQQPETVDRLNDLLCLREYIFSEVKEITDTLPILLDSLKCFSEKMVRAANDVSQKIRSVKETEILDEPILNEACIHLKFMAEKSDCFVDQVNDLFSQGRTQARLEIVKKAIGSNDFRPLEKFVSDLKTCLKNAQELYMQFDDASRVATKSCIRAAEICRQKSAQAYRDKSKTQARGEKKVKVAKAIGATASVIAFIPTLGIGAIAGGYATKYAVSAIKTATATKASHYEKLMEGFSGLSTDLDELGLIAADMDKHASTVHVKLELIAEHTNHINPNQSNDKASLCYSLDVLLEKFEECYRESSECRKQVQEMRKELVSHISQDN